jgi:hypothetical protein
MKKSVLIFAIIFSFLTLGSYHFSIAFAGTAYSVVSSSKGSDIEVKVYPNPFKEILNLEIDTKSTLPTEVKIFDIIGVQKQIIHLEDTSNRGKIYIQIRDLNEGIYFLNIYSDGKLLDTKKIICTK